MSVRAILAGVPPLTKLGQRGFDTAADLTRAVDKLWRPIDEQARSLRVEHAAGDASAKKAAAALTTNLAGALKTTSLILRADAQARFVLTLNLTSKLADERVMGQQVVYLTYTGTVQDTWSQSEVSGATGDTKGFGKTPEAALAEAAAEAAKKIAATIAASITDTVRKETGAE